VGKLWPTWDDYVTVGEQFKAKNTGAKWFDAASNTYNTILVQTAGKDPGYTYFDKSNALVIDSNPAIRQTYDRMLGMIGDGLSAGYKSFSDQWNAGFKQGTFATIACPAWMLGYIQGQAGTANKGKWDVTTAPGGGGNWGGSWLAVPTQSKHPKEAAELVRFLTSPKGQVAAFKAVNNLPSSPAALDDPALQSFTNPYFNNAPVGQIFGTGAKQLQPVYFGPRTRWSGTRWRTRCWRAAGSAEAADAWAKAVKDAQQARSSDSPVVPAAIPGRRRHHRPHATASTDRRDASEHRRHDPGPAATPRGGRARTARPAERFALLRSRADTKVSPYVYIAPFFVLFGIFGLYPLVYTAWVSLHDWQLASAEHPCPAWTTTGSWSPTRCSGTRWATPPACSCSPPCRSWRARCSWPACSTGGCAADVLPAVGDPADGDSSPR
jgi:hypothetical protein